MSDLRSLKKYSWLFSGCVAVVITVAGLSVSDFSWLPSEYQNYVVMIIGVCGVLAKVFVENARVTRAEELVHLEYQEDTGQDCIHHDDSILNDEYVVDNDGN